MEWKLEQFREELLDDRTIELIIKKSIIRDGEDLFGFDANAWADCAWEFIIGEFPRFSLLKRLITCNFDYFEEHISLHGGLNQYCQLLYQKRGNLEPFTGEFVKTMNNFEYKRSPAAVFDVIHEAGEKLETVAWAWCDYYGWFQDVYGDIAFY